MRLMRVKSERRGDRATVEGAEEERSSRHTDEAVCGEDKERERERGRKR